MAKVHINKSYLSTLSDDQLSDMYSDKTTPTLDKVRKLIGRKEKPKEKPKKAKESVNEEQ